ncbi:MAG: amidase family protein, partial [Henriciella sp.]
YLRAQKVRTRIAEDFDKAFEKVDALLTPTCPSAAFAYGEKSGDPVEMYLNDIFTVTANLAGLPGISVPATLDKQALPLGLQVIGKALDETSCFRVAGAIETAANFTTKPERWW